MKKLGYILLLFTQFFWGQEAFEKANSLYQKGDYTAAISVYEGILKLGQESPEVYFNMGNCYYKLNQVAPAIYNFEKAKRLSPNDSEIQNNLAFAQKMAIDDIKEVPKVGFSKVLQDFTSQLHYDTWAWLAVVLGLLFLASFVGYYFSYNTLYKRLFFTGMLVLLLSIVVSLASGFYEQSRWKSEQYAIVFAESVSVKSEPNASAAQAFMLHAGTKVQVLETIGNYYKIQLADLKEGWLLQNEAKIIQ